MSERIPTWAWVAGSATLLLGGSIVAALALRGRGRAVGAWESDWDDDESRSPWEQQVERFQQIHPQGAACRAEYNTADMLARQWRSKSSLLYCDDAEALTRAVEAAWEGDCVKARKLISRARCRRNPVAAPGQLQRRGWGLTGEGLTAKQLEALRQLRDRGPANPFDFGSTTVSRLRKLGLIRDDRTIGITRLVITDAGRAAAGHKAAKG